MPISDVKVKFNDAFSTTLSFVYTPAPDETRSVLNGFYFYGPSGSVYDPAAPNFGYPSGAALRGSGPSFSVSFNPNVAAGGEYHLVCGAQLDSPDLNGRDTEDSGDQKLFNQTPQGDKADAVGIDSASDEIPMGGSTTLTATALAHGVGTAGRNANFGFKTGSTPGTLNPGNPVQTISDGTAQVTFTPTKPGQAHLEVEIDGLKAEIKIKVKN